MSSVDEYNRMFEAVNSRMDRLERLVKPNVDAPTHPIYDSTNFPQDAVPGQHVQDQSNALWIFGNDGQWHKIGIANLPWGYARYDNAAFPSGSGLTQIDFDPAVGGFGGYTSLDPDITFGLSSSGRWTLSLNTVGYYLMATGWSCSVSSTPAAGSSAFLNSQWLPGRPITGSVITQFTLVPGGSIYVANGGALEPFNGDGVNQVIPKVGNTAFAQTSGSTASVSIYMFATKISDVYHLGQQ